MSLRMLNDTSFRIMAVGSAATIFSDVMEWIGSNPTIVLGIITFIFGAWKSISETRSIKKKTEIETKLAEERLKQERIRTQRLILGDEPESDSEN